MNKDVTDTLALWGDRSNRDTGHLMDLVIAGTIDAMAGHGTVRLMPARLEEVADRIGPRMRDPDGAWVVTLLPPEDDLAAVNPYDVLAYVREHREFINSRMDDGIEGDDMLALIQSAAEPGKTLRDMGMDGHAMFVEWVLERYVLASVDNQSG